MPMRLILALLCAALLGIAPASAQTFPKFTGLVVDAANVLPPETEAALTAKLQALQKDTHRQLVVATVPDTQGYPLEDYGYRLGREWGVGLRDVNNGVVLFVAPGNPAGQRGPRIEVGKGLEGIVTDALSDQIARQQMAGRLKREGGTALPSVVEQGTDALIAQLRASPEEAMSRVVAAMNDFDAAREQTTPDTSERSRDDGGAPVLAIMMLMFVGFFVLVGLAGAKGGSARRGRSYRSGTAPVVLWGNDSSSGSSWGSSGSSSSDSSWGGGGFSGGGGGSFGGGGASGDW